MARRKRQDRARKLSLPQTLYASIGVAVQSQVRRRLIAAGMSPDEADHAYKQARAEFKSWDVEHGTAWRLQFTNLNGTDYERIAEMAGLPERAERRVVEAQLDRLLDPESDAVKLKSLMRTTRLVGKKIKIDLVDAA